MTYAMTVRLDEETFQRLKDLEAAGAASRSAAVVAAIHEAWQHLQEQRLLDAYQAAVAESPTYPYEHDEERAALRARRNRRQATT
ncbi:antitoxin [Nocardia crassostreae]|uniref:antitoxin n=1 Tax=Nocardia crassostreae TaxID=53428 RepID=UPI001FE05D27|nr:antitoxin [Nocardia crassostreae]